MGGFFKPLRRKFGVATLVIACVFIGSWISWISEPHNEDTFSNADLYAIPWTLLSAYLLLSKPWPEATLEPPTMTHDGGPLPGSDSVRPAPRH